MRGRFSIIIFVRKDGLVRAKKYHQGSDTSFLKDFLKNMNPRPFLGEFRKTSAHSLPLRVGRVEAFCINTCNGDCLQRNWGQGSYSIKHWQKQDATSFFTYLFYIFQVLGGI